MDRNEAINWTGEALARVRDELDCSLNHYEHQEFSNIVTHMGNVDRGIRAIGGMIFEFVLNMRERAEIVKTQRETETGQLMNMEEFADGFLMYPAEVIVPEPEEFL